MKSKITWLLVSSFMVFSLLAASCGPTTTVSPTTPAASATQTISPTTGTQVSETTTTSAASAGPEMVKVSLKKLDGTVVEKVLEKPKYGGELTLMRNAAIIGWDEAIAPNYQIATSVDAVLEELSQGDWSRGYAGTEEVTWYLRGWFDVNYHTGSLAESWEVQQPDTITFKIRQGVHWGLNSALEASKLVGGRELTADDVLQNIKRTFFDIKTSSGYTNAGASRPVDAYSPDKSTVVVKTPLGNWFTLEYVTQWMSIYPPEIWKKYGDANDWSRCVGTDAFMLKDYVPMSAVTYIKNPNYWGKDPVFPENQLPYVDTIKLLIIPDASTRASAMRTGKVDIDDTSTQWEDANSLIKTNPELDYAKYPDTSTYLLGGREDKPELPFKDINVRRALMMAINHQEMVNTYFGGNALIHDYPIPSIKEWSKAYTPLSELGLAPDGFDTKKIYEFKPEEARQLLAQAGYPSGFKTEVVLTSTSVDVLSMIKAYWANIGVDLSLDVRETGVASSILQKKSHKEMYYASWASGGLAQNMDTNRAGVHYNWAMVTDPAVIERYDKLASLQPRSDEWWKTLKEAGIYLTHQVNYVDIPRTYIWFFWQPWVKGYHGEMDVGPYNRQTPFKYTWIDQSLKKSLGR